MAKTRGRKSSNSWAKCAGQYYRMHKHDKNIKSFSDVLKSPDFKKYYHTKIGKKHGGEGEEKNASFDANTESKDPAESPTMGGKSRKRKSSKRRTRRHR